MANALIHEKSPYLQQHAHNPVDWLPWGPEALERARAENKPLLVSIGYATCHWCHVMERESFEDPETAEALNRNFVCVKIDREERPDLDRAFMDALMAMGKGGGWPLNAFCTPEGVPFYGGTYFPPQPRYGLPAFKDAVEQLGQQWREREREIRDSTARLEEHLEQAQTPRPGALEPVGRLMKNARLMLEEAFDDSWGGFRFHQTNKFPSTMLHELLLAEGSAKGKEMVSFSLRQMLKGGIFDQVGGGLCRYSTDPDWLVPHFEKMLYDNAQFAQVLLLAHRATGEAELAQGAREVFAYLLRDLRDPRGAFYSAEDADSEGQEGKFYLWGYEELEALLEPEEFELARLHWGLSPEGNFEGANLLHQARPLDRAALELGQSPQRAAELLASVKARLLAARSQRPRPLRDEKQLCSWNALAIEVLALGALQLEGGMKRADGLGQVAVSVGQALLVQFIDHRGRLHRRHMEGDLGAPAFLSDYAQLGVACLALFELTWVPYWLEKSLWLAGEIERLFAAPNGGYYEVGQDQPAHLGRSQSAHDGVEPSGPSAVARLFARLHGLGYDHFGEKARNLAELYAQDLSAAPVNLAYMLTSLALLELNPRQLVISGDVDQAWLGAVQSRLPFGTSLLWIPPDLEKEFEETIPLARGKTAQGGAPRAHLCQDFACHAPITRLEELVAALQP